MTPHSPVHIDRLSVLSPRRARSGATLTEVLMSLMIMGLGITSVFTLFPMSVLRSIKSTNLTNAALLAESAREYYVFRKAQLSLPPARHNSYVDSHTKDALLYRSTNAAINSTTEGDDVAIPQPFSGTFMVDPYGGVNASSFGNDPGRYGRVLRVLNCPVNLGPDGVPGASGDPTHLLLGDDSVDLTPVTSLDSWITAYEDLPTSATNISVTAPPADVTQLVFPPNVNLTEIVSNQSRVLLMTTDNRQSFTRSLHVVPVPAGNPNYLHIVPPIPAADLARIGTVRLQHFERRYTYMYTLHYDESGESWGQIVVFFRREFGDSEQTYKIKDNSIDTLNRRITVQLGSGFSGRAPGNGDYIFGTWLAKPNRPVVHGRWYRVVSSVEVPEANWESPTSGPEYRVTLDRNWEGLWHPNNQPRAMLPKGVVSVFDL